MVDSFPDASLDGWKEKSFVGHTEYALVQEHGKTVLRGTTQGAASVLYKQKAISVTDTPWLLWQWKINSIYDDINERSKSGDDFPARLYVTAQVGFLPWESVAVNYVWSSHQALDSVWFSPYTNKSVMIAVQSGEANVNRWVSQQRNVVNDFKQFFNIDVEQITGLAVMVDGDNAGRSGTAYFGNIRFNQNPQ